MGEQSPMPLFFNSLKRSLNMDKSAIKTALRKEWPYLLVGLLGLVYSVLCYFDLFHFTVCPSKLIYNIPCPSCGTTRALMKVLHGDIVGGIMFNPNVILLVVIIVSLPILFYLRYTRYPDLFRRIDRGLARWYVMIPFGIIEICIWVHNISVGM